MSSRASTLKHQGETLEKATRYRETWTSAELELVREFEDSCSDRELADALGRTLYAVQAMKQALRERPAKVVSAARAVRTGAQLAYDKGWTEIPQDW